MGDIQFFRMYGSESTKIYLLWGPKLIKVKIAANDSNTSFQQMNLLFPRILCRVKLCCTPGRRNEGFRFCIVFMIDTSRVHGSGFIQTCSLTQSTTANLLYISERYAFSLSSGEEGVRKVSSLAIKTRL